MDNVKTYAEAIRFLGTARRLLYMVRDLAPEIGEAMEYLDSVRSSMIWEELPGQEAPSSPASKYTGPVAADVAEEVTRIRWALERCNAPHEVGVAALDRLACFHRAMAKKLLWAERKVEEHERLANASVDAFNSGVVDAERYPFAGSIAEARNLLADARDGAGGLDLLENARGVVRQLTGERLVVCLPQDVADGDAELMKLMKTLTRKGVILLRSVDALPDPGSSEADD